MNMSCRFPIQTGQSSLEKGWRGGGVHRKLVDPTTRRDLIVLGKDGDILQAVFLRNPIEMTLTPYLCSFLVFGLNRAPSFASPSLPAQETSFWSRGSIIRNVGIKGNERHITNPTFREESRARICKTQAVLGEKLSPRKLGGSNFPCLLQKLAGNLQSPKRALKFASSSHSRALDRTADGLI